MAIVVGASVAVAALGAVRPVRSMIGWTWAALFASREPRLERHGIGTISSPQTLGLGNFVVVRVDPDGRTVHVEWKGFNVRTGNAFRVPYEEIRLSDGSETYLVSSRDTGNNELLVDGKRYSFHGLSEQVLIRFGEGVSIEPGGEYRWAAKGYDADFLRPVAR